MLVLVTSTLLLWLVVPSGAFLLGGSRWLTARCCKARSCTQQLQMAGFALVPSNKDKDKGSIEEDASEKGKRHSPDSNCPCGSGAVYRDCCLPYHNKLQQPLDPVALVRARYSAYALENIDFIMDSTSAKSPDYAAYIESPIGARSGRKKWAKDIRKNMVDAFSYVHMEVDQVESDGNDASVDYRHLAISKIENTMYPIKERAFLSKVNGRWEFEAAVVERPDPDLSQKMMEEYPKIAGLKLIGNGLNDDAGTPEQTTVAAAPRAPRPRRATPKISGASAPQAVHRTQKK